MSTSGEPTQAKTSFHVRVAPALLEHLRRQAAEQGVSLNAWSEYLLAYSSDWAPGRKPPRRRKP
jgi:predicted HicB family RNase H-like nuclease